MTFNLDDVANKKSGDPVRSADWNELVDELLRLAGAKLDRENPSTITGNLGVLGDVSVMEGNLSVGGTGTVDTGSLKVSSEVRLPRGSYSAKTFDLVAHGTVSGTIRVGGSADLFVDGWKPDDEVRMPVFVRLISTTPAGGLAEIQEMHLQASDIVQQFFRITNRGRVPAQFTFAVHSSQQDASPSWTDPV